VQSLNDLNQAYQNFFTSTKGQRKGRPVKPPKFKTKNSKQTARFRKGGFKVGQHKVYLTKVGQLKIVWSRKLPSEPSSVTVIKDSANRYFLSFVVETCAKILPQTDNSVGIDLGIKTFATFSDSTKVYAPRPLKKRINKCRKLSKSLSKKTRGSKRYEKARLRVAKFHAKLKDTRTDFLHKLSTEIIRENQTIILEDLNVSGMVKKRCDPATTKVASGQTPRRRQAQGNADQERERAPRDRKLSRAISDLGWRQFRTFLEAKAEKYGRDFRVINRWEPTSQKCSCCGFKGGKLDLSIREWECLNCGVKHDRDENAAINILVAGGQSETLNGRGGKRQTTAKVAAACETSTR